MEPEANQDDKKISPIAGSDKEQQSGQQAQHQQQKV
jgi:hypothetical protein